MTQGTGHIVRADRAMVLSEVVSRLVQEHEGGEPTQHDRPMPPANGDRVLDRRQAIQLCRGCQWMGQDADREKKRD
jgi:hypothetical protein